MRKFNLDISDDQWGRELVFVGLYIIPAYPFATIADLLVVNSLEFWSDGNPVSGEKAITLSGLVPGAATDGTETNLVATAPTSGAAPDGSLPHTD